MKQFSAVLTILASVSGSQAAFVPAPRAPHHTKAWTVSQNFPATRIRNQDGTARHAMLPLPYSDAVGTSVGDALQHSSNLLSSLSSNSMWLATIDSDIASIPTNEFAPVFMGGIVVMLGGVLSALIVGTILEKRNLYANVIADSYAQGADDEQFWKGLSDEEKIKAQALIQKLNEKKAAEEGAAAAPGIATDKSASKPRVEKMEPAAPNKIDVVQDIKPAVASSAGTTKAKDAAEIDMFSDYADDA